MRRLIFPVLAVLAAATMGCDSASQGSAAAHVALRDDGQVTLEKMEAQMPWMTDVVNSSYGYAIFPEIGAAAIGVGGASGKGIVYRNGQPIGRITLDQASVGVQLGGDTFGELIVFQDDHAFNRMINNSIEFGADASATIIKSGAAGDKNFANGVKVFILPKGGLMAGVSVNGQKFHFTPTEHNNNS
ncbi:MAG TPA: YSC84-related protein [Tepidisphaeraceae bacterium]|jgi:lipid-binding SYLF domain-containing protein|nr:YSC84-related protein [Tepidisphaeraceae bacterium]